MRSRKQLLVLAGIAMVAFWAVLFVLDQKLKDAGGPSIVGFELAGSEQRAAEIVAEWGPDAHDEARWSLWIDFGFMLCYGTFLALAAAATRDFARENGLRRLAALGAFAPPAAVAAAVFDAAENVFLLLALGGHGGSVAPPLATACASIKFLLIVFAVLYILWGLAARLRLRGSGPRAQEPDDSAAT
jgi:hypothetical protein